MKIVHGPLTVHQIPCLEDNYAFLLRDEGSGVVATVDTPDSGVISAALDDLGWTLDLILNTHWHPDHVGGNMALKERYGATIIGPGAEGDRIPGRDQSVGEGDEVFIGDLQAYVWDTPGHTAGHIVYIFKDQKVGFVGDTLFSLGCGRLFEGTPTQMWLSLQKLAALPDDMTLYCAHEYTAGHVRFTLSIDDQTPAVLDRQKEVEGLRAAGLPTVPMTLGQERRTNLFLRADQPEVAEMVGLSGHSPTEVFAEIRSRKDNFL